jgi:spore coat protein M
MYNKRKRDCLEHVEGFEQWMDTFFNAPYEYIYCQNNLHIDLFETETAYIIEVEIPLTTTTHIVIHKKQNGITLCLTNKTCEDENIIELPIPIMNRAITAQIENSLLEIHISKTVPSSEQTLMIVCNN